MATFVTYHIASTQIVRYFDTAAAAKRSATCANRKHTHAEYAFAEYEEYKKNVVKKVMVRNLMTGELVEEDSNTPNCCSVGSESYWSM